MVHVRLYTFFDMQEKNLLVISDQSKKLKIFSFPEKNLLVILILLGVASKDDFKLVQKSKHWKIIWLIFRHAQ